MKTGSAAILIGLALTGTAAAQGAPGGARFCRQYAEIMSDIAAEAIGKNPACLNPSKGVHSVVQSHYDWCMRTPRQTVEGASDNIRRLSALCSGGRPPQPVAGIRPAPAMPQPASPCARIAGIYNGGTASITTEPGNRVRVMVGPNRPNGTGTCQGDRLSVNFPDDRIITGIFNGRTISWDNRTTWTKI